MRDMEGRALRSGLLALTVSSVMLLAACSGGGAGATPNATDTPLKPLATVRSTAVGTAGYTSITPAQLNTMLAQKDFTFVNVHIPYEGEIASTDAFIPYNEIDQKLDRLPADKSARIVLYCRSGRMSAIAAGTLTRLGYTSVWDLDGGMVAWENAGYKLLTR